MAAPAVQAAQGQLPIGGDHGDYAGLDQALPYVAQAAAGNGVLYHRELGWQARFYLFDAVQRGAIELRYFPSAVYLADKPPSAPARQILDRARLGACPRPGHATGGAPPDGPGSIAQRASSPSMRLVEA